MTIRTQSKDDYSSPAVAQEALQFRGEWITERRRIALWDISSRRRISSAMNVLQDLLAPVLSPLCTHIKGHGGVKEAVRAVQAKMPTYAFAARFDVASYYDSIIHAILLCQLRQAGMPSDLLELVHQYLTFPDTEKSGCGLTAGGSLSPLLGALYLEPLDAAFQGLSANGRIFYRRFMDDFVILATTRSRLRTAVRRVHRELATLGLRVHDKKRFIGRSAGGFDFLGYRLHPARRLRPSAESVRRLKERARRLYEQGSSIKRLRQYVSR